MKVRPISRHPVLDPDEAIVGGRRSRCFGCFRPLSQCYCTEIPSIENRTEILVVQHARERDHPFNTARMVLKALRHSQRFCGSNDALARIQLPLHSRAGLLYPSDVAIPLIGLAPDKKPTQLVVIDGTWSQARTMIRDLSQLRDLPHYKLAPSQPGQYRIRLEPTETSLSTVEATVQSLKELEPETLGLDQLLKVFENMVQQQLDHPRVGREHYTAGPKSGRTINTPRQLLGNPDSIVVAYGESSYRDFQRGKKEGRPPAGDSQELNGGSRRQPIYWVAKRLGTSESFSQAISPDVAINDTFLAHLELSHGHFDQAVSIQRFRELWRSFLRKGDTVVVYNQGTIGLLENIGADFEDNLTLKSINFCEQKPRRTLTNFVKQMQLGRDVSDPFQGRAGKRLSNAVALVNYLRAL